MIDCLVSSEPYWHHIAPIWAELQTRGHAGTLHSTSRNATQIGATAGTPTGDQPILVASARDLAHTPPHTPVVYTTHGAGQCYAGIPNSLINTTRDQLRRIRLAVSPNDQWTTNMHRMGVNTVTVGVPKMDSPATPPDLHDGPPKVGLVFHWDQSTYPESGSAFDQFQPVFADLAARFEVAATHHPRAGYQRTHRRSRRKTRVDRYDEAGIRFTPDLQDLLAESDLVVADNTSVMFEAAAAGWPVVVLDSVKYRRSVSHGLRFWDWADIGPRTNQAGDLSRCIEWAYERLHMPDGNVWHMREAVFPHWGEATRRAVDAIVEWAG